MTGAHCRGRKTLSQKGNLYISGGFSISLSVEGGPFVIEEAGEGSAMISWGSDGYVCSCSMASTPSIVLLDGAITISLADIAESTSSIYFKYVNAGEFTLALQSTIRVNTGDFIGAMPASLRRAPLPQSSPPLLAVDG